MRSQEDSGCLRVLTWRLTAWMVAVGISLTAPHASSFAQQNPVHSRPVDNVDVFTGTSNSRWMQFPGATMPMGLVKMSPDNQANVWNGGYEYTIASVAGFSFLHTIGLSSVSVMPVTGSLEEYPGHPKLFAGPSDGPFAQMWTAGYRSRINKTTEVGRPGYYAVDLLDAQTRVELTATERTGWMRFTPPADRPTHLIFDFGGPAEEQGRLIAVSVRRVNSHQVEGFVTQSNKYAGEFTVYFHTELSGSVRSMSSWVNGDYTGSDTNYGTEWRRPRERKYDVDSFESAGSGGVWLDLDSSENKPYVIRTGISLVSLEEARNNLKVEAEPFGFDFDKVAQAAGKAWDALLSRVDVQGGTADDRKKLYTNLYRAYTGKALLEDVSGTYRDACGEIQQVNPKGQHLYSSDAVWGAQWTLGPLWALLNPELTNSFNSALVLGAERGGWLPYAPVNMRYSPIMDAHHEVAMLAGAWQKNIRGFDGEAAYSAMRKVVTSPGVPYTCKGKYPQGRAGDVHLAAYMKYGYIPEEDGPASSTFEYAYDDACVASMARALGKSADALFFDRRSHNWKNSLSPVTAFAQRRRADGSWVEPNDLYHFGTTGGWTGPGFLEGTPWIYSWFVPQDVPGLVRVVGEDRFNQRLEEGFREKHVDLTNEPNLQAPWLFNFSGKPWLTQRYARYVFSDVFDTSPLNGWPGEEDEGQMGAYVVLAGIGLFDMQGGCTEDPAYQVSGPAFSKVVLHLAGGDFEIYAHNNSAANVYIQSAKLNGKQLNHMQISHKDVQHGGRLDLEMGATPNMAIH